MRLYVGRSHREEYGETHHLNVSMICLHVCGCLQLVLCIAIVCITIHYTTGPATVPVNLVEAGIGMAWILVLLATCGCCSHHHICSVLYAAGMMVVTYTFLLLTVMDFRGPNEFHLSTFTHVSNATQFVHSHTGIQESFVDLFEQGSFDCEVLQDGGNCSVPGGIECHRSISGSFEHAVNNWCEPSEYCDTCLQTMSGDPSKPENRIWCKCVGAVESMRIRDWLLLLLCFIVNALIGACACGVCCNPEYVPPSYDSDSLAIELQRHS